MEIDNLKSVWQEISTPQKNTEELNLMLKKYSCPMLSSIKKQLTIETTSFSVFLLSYFTMFDGQNKPLAINLVIISSILLQLFYGYRGYSIHNEFRGSENLSYELKRLVSRLRPYRLQTLCARIFFASSLLLFFVYNINPSQEKWIAISFIIEILVVQMIFFYRIWSKRINRLELVLKEFKDYAF